MLLTAHVASCGGDDTETPPTQAGSGGGGPGGASAGGGPDAGGAAGSEDAGLDADPGGDAAGDAAEGGEEGDAAPGDAGDAGDVGPDAAGPCASDADCVGHPDGEHCLPATGACSPCAIDDHCPPGSLCDLLGQCVPGCTPQHACDGGLSCCVGKCTDVGSDLKNCGACGNACPTDSGPMQCSGGTCAPGCAAGTADCNGQAADGCETSLSTPANCGGCGVACSFAHAAAMCSAGTCQLGACDAGWDNCDGDEANGCETQTATDLAHCGACGVVCNKASCFGGVCNDCPSGLGDCDANPGNGCETDLTTTSNCGACGATCTFPNAASSCAGGVCTLGACLAGYGNCNGVAGDGCEVSFSSPTNCGACGATCEFPNAFGACPSGVCTVGQCHAMWGDCNGQAADGCEQKLETNAHCGACNTACAPANGAGTCATGTCEVNSCNAPWADCDGDGANGCETSLLTSSAHCGACGKACAAVPHATVKCTGAKCLIDQCETGWADCNKSYADGCEVDLKTSSAHCGACGSGCNAQNGTATCSNGVCSVTCNSGWVNCDNNGANGCEANLNSDPKNCGACGTVCPDQNNLHYGGACTSGVCSYSNTCATNWGACDSSAINGCETNLLTSNSHCGACGSPCASPKSCVGGKCTCPAATPDACGSGCVNLKTDKKNCGSCGNVCAAGTVCQDGACLCQHQFCNGQYDMANACVNTQTNSANCGSCGVTCPAGWACSNGTCVDLYWTSGVQENVPESALAGWTKCYTGTYNASYSLATLLADCGGSKLLLACRPVGESNYTLLAMGNRDDVLYDCGSVGNCVHEANGVGWYYSSSYSWGFAPGGLPVNRSSCDFGALPEPERRMCWHTSGNSISSGYRCGSNNLNGNSSWERVAYTTP